MHSFVRMLRSALSSLSAGWRGSIRARGRVPGGALAPARAVTTAVCTSAGPVAAPPRAAAAAATGPAPARTQVVVPSALSPAQSSAAPLRAVAVTPAPVGTAAAFGVPERARAGRPASVATLMVAELRSIPARWIEAAVAGGAEPEPLRRGIAVVDGGAAVAVAAPPRRSPVAAPPEGAAAPRLRLPVSRRLHPPSAPSPHAPAVGRPPARWPLAPAAILPPCPLPDGALLYGGLSSAYVDGPSLLRELARRRHSGALVTVAGGRAVAAILHRGDVLALLATGRSGTRRLEGLWLPAAGEAEEHALAVPVYRPEVALALGQLVNLPSRFRRMHASFVRLPALLEHLAETGATGAVRITTAEDTGVLLLCAGRVLGSYTARYRALEDAGRVESLCAAGDAEIDVHAAPAGALPAAATVDRLLG